MLYPTLSVTSTLGSYRVFTSPSRLVEVAISRFKSANDDQKKIMITDFIVNRDDPIKSLVLETLSEQKLLHGFDFRGITFPPDLADFSGLDLTGALFSNLELMNAYFVGTNLSKAQMDGVNIRSSDFNHAIIVETNLSGAYLCTVEMQDVNQGYGGSAEVNFSGAHIVQSDFDRSIFRKSNFTKASLQGGSWRKTVVAGSDFSGAERLNNKHLHLKQRADAWLTNDKKC